MMRWFVIFGLAVTGFGATSVGLSGCSSGSAGSCGTTPSSCPTSAPSYATDVAPIVQKYCGSCHVAGGQESDKPLDTYSTLSTRSSEVAHEISGCDMPPSDATQPTTAEMQTVLDWIACGAQDN
ncbi:Hypothetical protein A7982_03605 [Minicystis rosea]|nr:Hypothetical protein A7982_03605 [Minicystis rosea]